MNLHRATTLRAQRPFETFGTFAQGDTTIIVSQTHRIMVASTARKGKARALPDAKIEAALPLGKQLAHTGMFPNQPSPRSLNECFDRQANPGPSDTKPRRVSLARCTDRRGWGRFESIRPVVRGRDG